jgi:hypothetical protein
VANKKQGDVMDGGKKDEQRRGKGRRKIAQGKLIM